MRLGKIFVLLAILGSCLLPARADEREKVLKRLDEAAKGFQTVSLTVEFDTIQTAPIYDKDVMSGVAYYERQGGRFQMAAHLNTHNNRPTGKTFVMSGGKFRLSESGKESDAKTYDQASKYESYLILGFGASGKELAEKWEIKYLGTEKIDGVVTDKLELIAKDPQVRKTVPKVTIWIDTARAVSLKQIFDEGDGMTRECHYSNIKVNQPLPKSAFSFDK
jgi:outer membrane lipoprotein-sorting protein